MKLRDLFKRDSIYYYYVVRPYIIAEAGVNHEGDLNLAKRLINEAAEGGAQAIKFQTYKASTIASKDSPSYWDTSKEPTESQFKLFQKYDKFWKDEYEELKRYCDEVKIEFISTPFDFDSAKFLNDIMDVFKISSSDITNKPFIEYICDFGKPIILSTGASYLHEVQKAVEWIDTKQVPVALLHCILNYPTDDQNAHLGMIKDLQRKFPEKTIGYSDHTLPNDMKTLELAALLGAIILEKHFTHDKTLPGNDHYHAMDKKDLKRFWKNWERIEILLGSFRKEAIPQEEIARLHARRSLVTVSNLPEGRVIEKSDLTFKRPAHGISPSEIENVLGKKTIKEIRGDTILQWGMLENDI